MFEVINPKSSGKSAEPMKYLTVKDIAADERFPFTMGSMRYLLSTRKSNGLAKAVRRIGKRLYIREDLFILWLVDRWEGSVE